MSDEVEDLIKRCVELREAGRLEEAILVARRANSIDPASANACWQLALSVSGKDGEASALEYFKKTVELASHFSYGWYKLGMAYKSLSMTDNAVECWETAAGKDSEDVNSRYELVDAYSSRELPGDDEQLFRRLIDLEESDSLRTYDNHLLAISYAKKKDYLNAIPRYKKYLSYKNDEYGYTNLSLAYSSEQISQELDAADCCHLALGCNEEFERAQKLLGQLAPKLEKVKSNLKLALNDGELLRESDWYDVYLSPFELFQLDGDSAEIEVKEIQKAKKLVLQEIDLEDGRVEWINNLSIDRSRVIKLAEEMTDSNLQGFHREVFNYKPLLNFLSRGSLDLFTYDPEDLPTLILLTLEYDESFALWLSQPFREQFNRLFGLALQARKLGVIEAMLDGRRFVVAAHEDLCFESGTRISEGLLEGLKSLQERVEVAKLDLEKIRSVLNGTGLARLLELLPPSFHDIQMEAAGIIRSISVRTYNKYQDPDLARDILKLAENFAKKSPAFRSRYNEDVSKLNDLIAEEKKDESYLTFGNKPFRITRESVTHGSTVIRSEDFETLRFGITVTNSSGQRSYKFIIVLGDVSGSKINVTWNSGSDKERQRELFDGCVNAIFSYVLPHTVKRFKAKLNNGKTVLVGGIPVTKFGVTLKSKGWFTDKDEFCSWDSLRSEIRNGDAVIQSTLNSKAEMSISLSEIDNAWILHLLIDQGLVK